MNIYDMLRKIKACPREACKEKETNHKDMTLAEDLSCNEDGGKSPSP
jgi:hypothetical protein